jgi:Ca2+/Na+ antiporter
MNATLLAFSNSAAECFIVINSIFFGVSDIGIQTACQQCAFSAQIIQGYFYTKTPEGTRIDWWISTRDTFMFICYLGLMSYFMQGNKIDDYAIYTLLVIYIVHVVLMKMNHSYEVALKKSVASFLEVRELNRLANENMSHFHYNLDTRNPSIEILNKINFR